MASVARHPFFLGFLDYMTGISQHIQIISTVVDTTDPIALLNYAESSIYADNFREDWLIFTRHVFLRDKHGNMLADYDAADILC